MSTQTHEWSAAGAPTIATCAPRTGIDTRPHVAGKFLFVGHEKLYVRGVTYGPFAPNACGHEYHNPGVVRDDFTRIAAHGMNVVRTYTVPPRWFLDLAARIGLRVMIGVPWEQHVTFLDQRATRQRIEQRVRDAVRTCHGHPAVLAFAIGNEIPASIVRWHGRQRVERFLKRLCDAARAEDPDALITYANFPSTEYLRLPFLDFQSFNVYLETTDELGAYLARLQHIADEAPLLLSEVGFDSLSHGEDAQAHALHAQVRTAFERGCAGLCAFAWTDEWHRGGQEITDWAFGLTDRRRAAKPALHAVSHAFADTPFPVTRDWPDVSVVVCTHNGAATIGETCAALQAMPYPDYEVIVVDDGSRDETARIARRYDVQLIQMDNQGLSAARNVGMRAASGQIIAYIDDDAYPDPHWLHYLAHMFMATGHVGVAGPNIPPPRDGALAECIAHAPGGPRHVLLSDEVAEHIPGCNMAFRKAALEAVGGFDAQFRIAGDDVDVCWRLQQQGGTLGFHPAAMVWHHRRGRVRDYLRQQSNYGRAEAMLEAKWPEKYNHFGHVAWSGRVYDGAAHAPALLHRARVYHGVWGTEPFQAMYCPSPGFWRSLPMMPEWYLLLVVLTLIAVAGVWWQPLLLALPLLALAVSVPVAQSLAAAARPVLRRRTRWQRGRRRVVIAMLHLAQPITRLKGRLLAGLTPWRRPKGRRFALPRPRVDAYWQEGWQSPEHRLSVIEQTLHQLGARVRRGGVFDRWDLEVRGGLLGGVRLLMVIEEHGTGQLVRLRVWPKVPTLSVMLAATFAALGGLTLAFSAGAGIVLGALAVGIAVCAGGDCMAAMAAYFDAVAPRRAAMAGTHAAQNAEPVHVSDISQDLTPDVAPPGQV